MKNSLKTILTSKSFREKSSDKYLLSEIFWVFMMTITFLSKQNKFLYE